MNRPQPSSRASVRIMRSLSYGGSGGASARRQSPNSLLSGDHAALVRFPPLAAGFFAPEVLS